MEELTLYLASLECRQSLQEKRKEAQKELLDMHLRLYELLVDYHRSHRMYRKCHSRSELFAYALKNRCTSHLESAIREYSRLKQRVASISTPSLQALVNSIDKLVQSLPVGKKAD